jgi:excisionase family DNA binding protein
VTGSAAQSEGAAGTAFSRVSEADCSETLLTAPEVAKLLRVPVSWVYERTRRRGIDRLPHLKLGKYLRFSESEIANWLQRMRGI